MRSDAHHYENRSGALERQKGKPRITEGALLVDLLNPTEAEEKKVERALKFDVPTREEQQEIEVSSRLYQENGALFMTASVITQSEQAETKMTPVTFILPDKGSSRPLCRAPGLSPSISRDATDRSRSSRPGPRS
jgi:magnesium transporter